MGEGQFDKALSFFIKGALDPRILICLFPEFSQDKSFEEFRKTLKQNFGFESVDEVAEKLKPKATPEATKARCADILRDYMIHLRTAKVSGSRKEEIDSCLAKIYGKNDRQRLYELLRKENEVSLEQLEPYFTETHVRAKTNRPSCIGVHGIKKSQIFIFYFAEILCARAPLEVKGPEQQGAGFVVAAC